MKKIYLPIAIMIMGALLLQTNMAMASEVTGTLSNSGAQADNQGPFTVVTTSNPAPNTTKEVPQALKTILLALLGIEILFLMIIKKKKRSPIDI